MHNDSIDRDFVLLALASFFLHAIILAVIVFLPPSQPQQQMQAIDVDLRDLPVVREEPTPQERRPSRRLSAERRSVQRETAPQGERPTERRPSPQLPALPRQRAAEQAAPPRPASPQGAPAPPSTATGTMRVPQQPSGAQELFRPKREGAAGRKETAQLFPMKSFSQIEEYYQKKYEAEVARGDTAFLNTEDVRYASFLRRLEARVYGVWRYPEAASRAGIQGVTVAKVTFSRDGKVVRREVLDSAGSRILDDEVLRVIDNLGPLGRLPLPKDFQGDTFSFIGIFQYSGYTRLY